MEDRIPGYIIGDKIGEGGMGRIYRALHEGTGRVVAIKVLAPAQHGVTASRGRFLRESILLSTLRHPNICRLLDSGETAEGHDFFATELLSGESLQHKLGRKDLAVVEAVDIALQVAQGLSVAHGKGIIHRDVKPANLMLAGDGKVKILDFGLARFAVAEGVSMAGEVLGTPVYAAPEQLRAEEVDARADLWALGVILYEMVAGIVPFVGSDALTVGTAVLTKEPVALRDWCPEAPPELAAIVGKALAKDRANRYDSAERLASDLLEIRHVLESEQVLPSAEETEEDESAGAVEGRTREGLVSRIRRWLG